MLKEPPKNSREKTKNLLLTLQDKICSVLPSYDNDDSQENTDIEETNEDENKSNQNSQLNLEKKVLSIENELKEIKEILKKK